MLVAAHIMMAEAPAAHTEPQTGTACKRRKSTANALAAEYGLGPHEVSILSAKLAVEPKAVLAETLAHCCLCRKHRGGSISREELVEVWDAVPESYCNKDEKISEAHLIPATPPPSLRLPNSYPKPPQLSWRM